MENKTEKMSPAKNRRFFELHSELAVIETFIADYGKLRADFVRERTSLIRTVLFSGLLCVFFASLVFLLNRILPNIDSIYFFIIFMSVFAVILFLNFLKFFIYLQNFREYRKLMARLERKRSEKCTQINTYPHS